MSGIEKHESSDATHQGHSRSGGPEEGGKPVSDHAAAEQSREAQEAKEAVEAEGSIRARMLHIGRGNQQSGRQGQ